MSTLLGFPVSPQHLEQARREHDVAILAPFTLIDPQRHALAVDVGHLKWMASGTRKLAAYAKKIIKSALVSKHSIIHSFSVPQ